MAILFFPVCLHHWFLDDGLADEQLIVDLKVTRLHHVVRYTWHQRPNLGRAIESLADSVGETYLIGESCGRQHHFLLALLLFICHLLLGEFRHVTVAVEVVLMVLGVGGVVVLLVMRFLEGRVGLFLVLVCFGYADIVAVLWNPFWRLRGRWTQVHLIVSVQCHELYLLS